MDDLSDSNSRLSLDISGIGKCYAQLAPVGEADGTSLRVNKSGVSYQVQSTSVVVDPLEFFPEDCTRYMEKTYPETYQTLVSIPREIRNTNSEKVINMQNMFSGCKNITSVPLYNTANVTNMWGMFSGCFALESVPLFNTRKVVSMSNMFSHCKSLVSVPTFDISSVRDASNMFAGCNSLANFPPLDFSKVEIMYGLLSGCSSLVSMPPINTSSAKDISGMFLSCYNTTYIPPLITNKVEDFSFVFMGCHSLKSLSWDIDMTSCVRCDNMLNDTNLYVRLKNVPRSLNFSRIGSTNYTVLNYI